ncbi:DUF2207 domain-containing protein [Clostridium akagii]|uniref:DUF2207 domain-containing protein n=1 Tax=Clostridium akagii TaxID=91623 RepID=UPI00047B64C6|nr:DUF2207 domain-containing protein [Clostridium akagii]
MIKSHKVFTLLVVMTISIFSSIFFAEKAFGATDNYYISNIVINASVKENGDMAVQESHDYVFQGSLNGIKRDVKTKGSDGITDISAEAIKDGLSEKNKVDISKDSDKTEIKIYSKSNNETKNFRINYTLKNVVTKFSNLGELKWVFYTNDSNVRTNKITIFITLPENITNQVKYYGEGPKSGMATLDNKNQIKLELNNMEDKDVIGAIVLFPSAWVKTSKTINMDRDSYYAMIKRENNIKIATVVLIIFVIILILSVFFYKRTRKRRKAIDEYRQGYTLFSDTYYKQLPSELPPALVSKLINSNDTTNALLATILSFASKGAIKFLEEGFDDKDYQKLSFKINDFYQGQGLMDYELFLLQHISEYSKNGVVMLVDLKKNAGKTSFINKYTKWKELVTKQAEKLGFYTIIEGKKILTNEYENEKLKWIAFKDYLRDHKDIQSDAEGEDLSEKIVPYAIVLDVSENIVNDFEKVNGNNYNNIFMSYWFLSYYTTTYNEDFSNSYSNGSSSSDANFSGSSGGDFGGGGGGSAF